MLLRNRQDAGQQLAAKLDAYKKNHTVIVIGLPRGGVIVAAEIAHALNVPLDIIVSRKIGAPGNPEFAIGAITEEGETILNDSIIETYNISTEYITQQLKIEQEEIFRRKTAYRGNRPELELHGKTALLVDDGIATGYTMRAAMLSARAKGAQHIIVVTPVIAADMAAEMRHTADECVCLYIPTFLGSVGSFYEEFEQVNDEEVIALLNRAM